MPLLTETLQHVQVPQTAEQATLTSVTFSPSLPVCLQVQSVSCTVHRVLSGSSPLLRAKDCSWIPTRPPSHRLPPPYNHLPSPARSPRGFAGTAPSHRYCSLPNPRFLLCFNEFPQTPRRTAGTCRLSTVPASRGFSRTSPASVLACAKTSRGGFPAPHSTLLRVSIATCMQSSRAVYQAGCHSHRKSSTAYF